MANVTAGLGVQIYDNSYTGGASDKIASIISGKLQVETGVITVNPYSGSVQTIQGNVITSPSSGSIQAIQGSVTTSPNSGSIQIIQGNVTSTPSSGSIQTIQGSVTTSPNSGSIQLIQTTSGFPLSIQGVTSGLPLTIEGLVSGFPIAIQGITSGSPLTIQGLVSGAPIITTESEVLSNTINVYGTSSNVTSTSSAIIAYYNVPAGKSFLLKEVIASASSGPVKVIVEYAAASTGASSGTYTVGFFSSANPTLAIPFYQPIVATGATYVRVTMRNDSAFTQDLYATIIGRLV